MVKIRSTTSNRSPRRFKYPAKLLEQVIVVDDDYAWSAAYARIVAEDFSLQFPPGRKDEFAGKTGRSCEMAALEMSADSAGVIVIVIAPSYETTAPRVPTPENLRPVAKRLPKRQFARRRTTQHVGASY